MRKLLNKFMFWMLYTSRSYLLKHGLINEPVILKQEYETGVWGEDPLAVFNRSKSIVLYNITKDIEKHVFITGNSLGGTLDKPERIVVEASITIVKPNIKL